MMLSALSVLQLFGIAISQEVIARGVLGIDLYPRYTSVPETSFSCDQFGPGYYADPETGCQAFHVCHTDYSSSFLCPAGSIFNQEVFVCDWWYNVRCDNSPQFYSLNSRIGHVLESTRGEAIANQNGRVAEPKPDLTSSTPGKVLGLGEAAPDSGSGLVDAAAFTVAGQAGRPSFSRGKQGTTTRQRSEIGLLPRFNRQDSTQSSTANSNAGFSILKSTSKSVIARNEQKARLNRLRAEISGPAKSGSVKNQAISVGSRLTVNKNSDTIQNEHDVILETENVDDLSHQNFKQNKQSKLPDWIQARLNSTRSKIKTVNRVPTVARAIADRPSLRDRSTATEVSNLETNISKARESSNSLLSVRASTPSSVSRKRTGRLLFRSRSSNSSKRPQVRLGVATPSVATVRGTNDITNAFSRAPAPSRSATSREKASDVASLSSWRTRGFGFGRNKAGRTNVLSSGRRGSTGAFGNSFSSGAINSLGAGPVLTGSISKAPDQLSRPRSVKKELAPSKTPTASSGRLFISRSPLFSKSRPNTLSGLDTISRWRSGFSRLRPGLGNVFQSSKPPFRSQNDKITRILPQSGVQQGDSRLKPRTEAQENTTEGSIETETNPITSTTTKLSTGESPSQKVQNTLQTNRDTKHFSTTAPSPVSPPREALEESRESSISLGSQNPLNTFSPSTIFGPVKTTSENSKGLSEEGLREDFVHSQLHGKARKFSQTSQSRLSSTHNPLPSSALRSEKQFLPDHRNSLTGRRQELQLVNSPPAPSKLGQARPIVGSNRAFSSQGFSFHPITAPTTPATNRVGTAGSISSRDPLASTSATSTSTASPGTSDTSIPPVLTEASTVKSTATTVLVDSSSPTPAPIPDYRLDRVLKKLKTLLENVESHDVPTNILESTKGTGVGHGGSGSHRSHGLNRGDHEDSESKLGWLYSISHL